MANTTVAKNALVNNIDHKEIKIITDRSAEYGDNVWYSLTFPAEFRSIQAYYPIFFNKDPETGKFFSVALFGFQNQENLFLADNKWDAPYIPLSMARQPFMIGTQKVLESGQEKQQRVLHIDLEHPRVNTERGEALFLEFGGNSDYLDTMANMLEALHHGVTDSNLFIETVVEHDLLEPFTLDLTLNDGSQHQMVGFYTINEEKLNTLSPQTLADLQSKGYLQAIYMSIASQSNVRDLMNRKNAQLGL
jgi:hypothetical protein